MAKLSTYTCDECNALMTPTNNWYAVNFSPAERSVTIKPIKYGDAESKHLCGQEHVQKVVARFLAGHEIITAEKISAQEITRVGN